VLLVEFRVLGPVEAHTSGQLVDLGRPQQRLVLAVLLVDAGRPVSTETLIDRVWDSAPDGARRTLQVHITRLRRLLAETSTTVGSPAALTRRSGGYLLDIDLDRVDVHRFRRLVNQARQGECPEAERVTLLGQALELWRGQPLADLPGEWATRVRHGWQDQYLETVVAWAQACLQVGDPGTVLPRLSEQVAEHPLVESLVAAYLRALYAAGRPADALGCYSAMRHRLADELGTDPGPELQQLHRQILTSDPVLTSPSAIAPVGPTPVPRQLPAPPQLFTGRVAELADLDHIHDASTVVVTAIDGMAGIGKTALAVHAAHRIADRYPDGQLFLDLHGHTQDVEPIEPAEALDHLLRALGIPGAQIPTDLHQRAALYRTRLADQRMLIVLDNAAAEPQVAPLLPGAPGCLVLVTSRHRLSGLDHTHTLSLDTLPAPDAITLFIQTAGEDRRAGQPPELLAELVQLCGRLPLALRIAAARLRAHSAWGLSDLVERLRDQQNRLGELEAGQRNVTAALDVSYQHLSSDQQQAYRLLGLHPGPEFDAYAAAALLDSTLPHARRMLDHLLEAHLLQEPMPGRHRFHDLIRAHAHAAYPTDPPQGAALERLFGYYRHTASAAMDAAYPYEREDRPEVPPAGTPSPDLPDTTAGLGWLDIELPNLLAVARYATEPAHPTYILDLSTILHRHLRTRGRYHDAEALHQQALTTARATGDQTDELAALVGLGAIHRLLGRHAQAADYYRQALHLARTISNRTGEMNALHGLGEIHRLQGRYTQAADHYRQALHLARTIGNRAGEMNALHGLGEIHRPQGRLTQAADNYRQALQLARTAGHHIGELDALSVLGHIHRQQGRYQQAADHYEKALQLARATNHRASEMNTLNGRGYIYLWQGRYQQAADDYQQALQLARTIGNRSGEMTALNGLGHIHRRQGRHEQARDHYQRLFDLAQEDGSRNWQFEGRQGLGRLELATDHPAAAIAHHEQALALALELGHPGDQARAHDGLAYAHHALHQPQQARTHWQHALDILTDLGFDHTEDEETTTAAIRTHLAGS
jgi:tetratricopeptide (TPR) repeat protein